MDASRIAAVSLSAELPAEELDELAAALGEVRLLSLSQQEFERIRARVPALERSLRRLSVERAGR